VFSNHTEPPDLYTLSLHDALPICSHGSISPSTTVNMGWAVISRSPRNSRCRSGSRSRSLRFRCPNSKSSCPWVTVSVLGFLFVRSEEHTSELQSRFDLVCRLLLEK